MLSGDVNRGEAECLVCCIEQKINVLVMDDVSAAYCLEGIAIANGIGIKISVAVLVEMQRQGIITKKELKNAIKKLIERRGWEGGALEILAKKYLNFI